MNNIYVVFAQSIQAQEINLPFANFDATLPSILKAVFTVAAILSLIFVAFGGFKYTTSNGDPQGIASAKNTILAALVGLIIAISAFSIVSFVGSRL